MYEISGFGHSFTFYFRCVIFQETRMRTRRSQLNSKRACVFDFFVKKKFLGVSNSFHSVSFVSFDDFIPNLYMCVCQPSSKFYSFIFNIYDGESIYGLTKRTQTQIQKFNSTQLNSTRRLSPLDEYKNRNFFMEVWCE